MLGHCHFFVQYPALYLWFALAHLLHTDSPMSGREVARLLELQALRLSAGKAKHVFSQGIC